MQEPVEALNATVFPTAYWQCPGTSLEDALAAGLGDDDVAIDVKVNQGRWIAECPDCCGAQLTARSDPRFMCNYCANVVIGGVWRPVRWPALSTVNEIEAVLEPRPIANQNWFPTETVDDLTAENEAHGVSA